MQTKQKELLDSYTNADIQEITRVAEPENNEVNHYDDTELESFVDDMLDLNPKTNDVFGMTSPMENINKVPDTDEEPKKQDVQKIIYHDAVESLAYDLQIRGGISIDKDGKRHKTLNPSWYNNGAFQVMSVKGDRLLETTPSVQKIHDCMNAYLDPIKQLTKPQLRIIEALHNLAIDLEIESDYMGNFDVELMEIEALDGFDNDYDITDNFDYDSDPTSGFYECSADDFFGDMEDAQNHPLNSPIKSPLLSSYKITLIGKNNLPSLYQLYLTFLYIQITLYHAIKSPLLRYFKSKSQPHFFRHNFTNPQYNCDSAPTRNLGNYRVNTLFFNPLIRYKITQKLMFLCVFFIRFSLMLFKPLFIIYERSIDDFFNIIKGYFVWIITHTILPLPRRDRVQMNAYQIAPTCPIKSVMLGLCLW